MSLDLNLLPNRAKFQAAKMKLKAKIRDFMVLAAAGWLVVVAGVFAYWTSMRVKYNSAQKQYQQSLQQYQQMAEDVLISEEVKYRAKMVGKILSERFEYGEALNLVGKMFSDRIKIDRYELKNKNLFEVAGTIVGREGVDELERKIEEINAGRSENFYKANLKNLALASGIWEFGMEVYIR